VNDSGNPFAYPVRVENDDPVGIKAGGHRGAAASLKISEVQITNDSRGMKNRGHYASLIGSWVKASQAFKAGSMEFRATDRSERHG
jgi:hypothetical protein